MTVAETHHRNAEAALEVAHRNPVLSADQAFRAAHIHALLAIDAHLAQLVESVMRPALAPSP